MSNTTPIMSNRKSNLILLVCVFQLIVLLAIYRGTNLIGFPDMTMTVTAKEVPSITVTSDANVDAKSDVKSDTDVDGGVKVVDVNMESTKKTLIVPPFQPREGAQCAEDVLMRTSRKPERKKTFATKHLYDKCEFVPLEEGGPLPVVFLVNGRSGSTNTWGALSTLAGGKSPIGEHTGQNRVTGIDFVGNMTTKEEGYWWMSEFLCEFSKVYCDKPLAGIKWKPFMETWDMPAAQGFLDLVANFSLNGHKMKLIFMSRNQLDVLLSNIKHRRMKHKYGGRIFAHCEPDDELCLKEHKEASEAIKLPTEGLVQELKKMYDGLEYFEKSLNESGIDYYRTYYEKLYNSGDAEEWMNIFKYLGRGPTKDLTMDEVNDSMPFALTTSKTHREMLKNYDEVKEALAGTDFAHLLH